MILHESERLDFSKVPQSQGVPKRVYWILVVGVLGIFMMGYLSVILSGYGHMWPYTNTMRTGADCDSNNSQTCSTVLKKK